MNNEQEEALIFKSFKEMMELSELSYKRGDYKKSFLERLKAKEFIIGDLDDEVIIDKFKLLYKSLNFHNSKYNLINDYLLKINEKKKLALSKYLENQSISKFKSGDYKGAIRSLRRSEKYY